MALIQTSALGMPAKSQLGSGNSVGTPSGIMSEQVYSEVLPRYSTLTKLGKIFAARGALQTLSVAGTAMTGLIVWNSSPAGAGVDLHMLKISGDVAVTSATMTGIALAFGKGQVSVPGAVTAASAQNCTYIGGGLGGNVGAGLAYNVATMTNAPVAQFDVLHNTAAISTTGEDTGFIFDCEGLIVVPPQQYICFVALGAASAASAVNLSAVWAEVAA